MSFACSGGMDWQKSVLQKDKIYNFKYRECTINTDICTINNHIFDNLIQISIKFTFTVYDYIIR